MNSNISRSLLEPSASWGQQTWWYKPLIWGTFLALLYVLRGFFLIGFLTFLICFIVRSVVGFLVRRIAPASKSRGLDLVLTLAVLLGICLGLYGLGRYFVPQLIRQGKSLLVQIQDSSAEQLRDTLLANTVGAWRFQRQFGKPEDARYQKAQGEFQATGRYGEGLYREFPGLHSRLQADFEANYEQAQMLQLQSFNQDGSADSQSLEQWFMAVKAPALFHDKSDYYLLRWEAEYASPDKAAELATLKQKPDFESRRDAQIRSRIWEDVQADPVLLAELKNQWAHALSIQAWDSFRNSSQYQSEFKKFYQARFNMAGNNVPIDYQAFQTLAAAYPQGEHAFMDAVKQLDATEKESPAHQQFDFESATKMELARKWWATSHVADWVRDHAANDGPKVMEGVLKRFDEGFGHLLRIPTQIITAMLLAFAMLVEWPGLNSGVADLRNTRLQPIFDEVAPGVIALGKLIGKSFQGQVIISFANACLVLVALWLIGVDYKFILTLVAFVFSFIPVLGVILSGIPICGMAIMQPGGSLMMAVQVTVAIAMIHIFEGMVLSPRIIGKIGHLNPVLVIVILLVAEHFFGMWGLVLGVPVSIYILRVVILRAPIPGIYEPR